MNAQRGSRPLRVGVIGAGRVGAVLGAALAAAGHRIVAASAVSSGSVARARRFLPGVPLLPVDEVPRGVDLLLLAVPDDALGPLVRGLVGGPKVGGAGHTEGPKVGGASGSGGVAEVARGSLTPGQLVVHTSGAHGLAVLAPAVEAGVQGIALHPAMTFTGEPSDLQRLAEGISFGVTASQQLRARATRLVADLGGSIEWIDEQNRPLYHAALAHGANHLVTLVNEAADRLRDAGIQHPERVLAPLLRAALENTLDRGDAALTGPVARGDAGTIARHLEVLSKVAPGSVAAYLALARRTADRAIAAGRLRPVDAEPLLGVLAQQTSAVELRS